MLLIVLSTTAFFGLTVNFVSGAWFNEPLLVTNDVPIQQSKMTYEVQGLVNSPIEFESVMGAVKSFCAVTIFGERGAFSGHCYQPFVNHRQMSFESIHHAHTLNDANVPALMESMVKPSKSNSFSLGNVMSFIGYEMNESSAVTLPAIESPAALAIPGSGEEPTRYKAGALQGYGAGPVTVAGWKRLLHVFGRQRGTRYEAQLVVSAEEIVSFLEVIGEHNLGTLPGLRKFIAVHKMEWLFSVSDAPIVDQLNTFFALIRALVPFRLAAYDGRHRFNLCCCFATGYFNLKPTIHMLRSPATRNFPKAAVFLEQRFIISQPSSEKPLSTLLGKLRNSGVLTTANQALNVESSWTTLILEFIQYLIRTGASAKLQKLDYSTYWEPTAEVVREKVLMKNIKALWNAFCDFLKEAPETREPLVKGDSALTMPGIFMQATPIGKKSNGKCYLKSLANPHGQGRAGKPPKNVPKNLSVFSSALRYCCDDFSAISNLRDLMVGSPSTYPQKTITDQQISDYTRDIQCLRIYVLGTSTAATDHFLERTLVERAMLYEVSSKLVEPFGEAVQEDLDNNWPAMPCANGKNVFKRIAQIIESSYSEKKKSPMKTKERIFKRRRNLNDSDFGTACSAPKLTSKFRFACQSTLFRDILKTILKYGWNPKVEIVDEKNHKLSMLLK